MDIAARWSNLAINGGSHEFEHQKTNVWKQNKQKNCTEKKKIRRKNKNKIILMNWLSLEWWEEDLCVIEKKK